MLSDQEILQIINSGDLNIHPFDPSSINLTQPDSPIQPSSLDLHIGHIYIPPKKVVEMGKFSTDYPEGDTGYRLPAGHSVIVETEEVITLGNRISAFGFPPASMARGAILMTNPGHIDPGFSGKLTFSMINMGRQEACLKKGDIVVTLLLFRFNEGVHCGYSDRYKTRQSGSSKLLGNTLNALAPDFANLTERAERLAESQVEKQRLSLEVRKIYIPVILTLLTGIGAFLFGKTTDIFSVATENFVTEAIQQESEPLSSRLSDLEQKLLRIEATADALALDERLDEMQERMDALYSEEP